MSELPPFWKWGSCKSEDESNPDKLVIVLKELDTFETEYGINYTGTVNGTDYAIPVYNFNSANKSLYKKIKGLIASGKIKQEKPFKVSTWLGKSKNDRKIRKWEVEP